MHPALSVILFTTVSGAGYGLLGLLCGLGATGHLAADRWLGVVGFALALLAIAGGLICSTFHLGRPLRAWRTFFYWSSSWLSREAVLSLLTLVPAAAFLVAWLRGGDLTAMPVAAYGIGAAALAGLTVLATAMIYASLKPIRAWRSLWVVPNYLALATMTGGLWLAVLIHGFGRAESWHGELLLLVIVAACLIKVGYWYALDRWKGRSTPQSATGLGTLGRVRSFERPNVVDNYVMREMAFQIARKHSLKLRRIALAGSYLAPVVFTLLATLLPRWPATGCALIAACAAIAGVLVERWLFFAEAKHAVTLYYGAETV